MKMLRVLAIVLCVLTAQSAPARIDGKWRGIFYAYPDPRDDGNREREFGFELTISTTNDLVTGMFRNITAKTAMVRIVKGECRNGTCCFEVADDPREGPDVNTWCVSSKANTLQGTRNGGEMTALGMGIGARLFRVIGRRILR